MGKLTSLKNRQVLTIFLFGIILLTQYTNCTTYQDDSLFNSQDGNASVQTYDNKLFSPNQTVIVKATEDMVSVTGECNINSGTGSNHFIEARIIANNVANTQFRVREDGSCFRNPVDNVGAPECFVVKASCNYGKYYFNLPVDNHIPGNGAAGCEYRLRLQLVTTETGVEKRESKHQLNLPAYIYGAGGTCIL